MGRLFITISIFLLLLGVFRSLTSWFYLLVGLNLELHPFLVYFPIYLCMGFNIFPYNTLNTFGASCNVSVFLSDSNNLCLLFSSFG